MLDDLLSKTHNTRGITLVYRNPREGTEEEAKGGEGSWRDEEDRQER